MGTLAWKEKENEVSEGTTKEKQEGKYSPTGKSVLLSFFSSLSFFIQFVSEGLLWG